MDGSEREKRGVAREMKFFFCPPASAESIVFKMSDTDHGSRNYECGFEYDGRFV